MRHLVLVSVRWSVSAILGGGVGTRCLSRVLSLVLSLVLLHLLLLLSVAGGVIGRLVPVVTSAARRHIIAG